MDERTRNILIGLGVVAGIGAVSYFIADEELQEKARGSINRLRVKHFVKTHLNGSEHALRAVDNMDASEVNRLLDTVDRFEELESQFSNYGREVKGAAADVKDRVVDYTQSLIK